MEKIVSLGTYIDSFRVTMAEEKLAVAPRKAAVCRQVLAVGLTLALEWENDPLQMILPERPA